VLPIYGFDKNSNFDEKTMLLNVVTSRAKGEGVVLPNINQFSNVVEEYQAACRQSGLKYFIFRLLKYFLLLSESYISLIILLLYLFLLD
jgi:hypothetical protein